MLAIKRLFKRKEVQHMLKWLCYDESAIFYVEAVSREEAQAYALLYDGYVVCPVNDMEKSKISSVQSDGQ